MKIKLTIAERITLLSIFPVNDNYVTMKVISEMSNTLGIGKEEAEKIELRTDGDSVKWNPELSEEKEFDFGKFEIDVIHSSLKKLDDEKKIGVNHLSLWNKFLEK